MNIFFLSMLPRRAAKFHCDKHCVKMILETTQMLYTVWAILNSELLESLCPHKPYKPTHINHPSNVWARESYENYRWLVRLGVELCKEYTRRYGKEHTCEKHLLWMYKLPKSKCINMFSKTTFTMPYLAMPEECKIKNNPVASYRTYYIEKKASFAKWNHSKTPFWFNINEN